MKFGTTSTVLRDTQALFAAGTLAGLDDDQLLDRFVGDTGVVSELAFAALVARHGPMVLAACLRAIGDRHGAEDAFQATFLVLARRARSVRGATLGPWLFGVARKVALKHRAGLNRRQSLERTLLKVAIDHDDPSRSVERVELSDLIDRELSQLPPRLRDAVVLCDLQGLSHEEAARHLGCPLGTIKSRQARARDRLRHRLGKLGLDPASVVGPVLLAPRLTSTTANAAAVFLHTGSLPAGSVPTTAAALALSTLRGMTMISIGKFALAGTLGLASLAGGLVVQDQNTPRPTEPALPTTATSAAVSHPPSLGPTVSTGIGVGQDRREADRLKALEDKLDRVLNALERASPLNMDAARLGGRYPATVPAPAPTARGGSSRDTTARASRPPEAAAPNARGGASNPPNQVIERLEAVEKRLDALERAFKTLEQQAQRPGTTVPTTEPPSGPFERSPVGR